MNRLTWMVALLLPCSATALAVQPQLAPRATTALAVETLADDAPRTTIEGNRFLAPAGWSVRRDGAAVLLMPPEEGARMALVDVRAADADAAVAAAWAAL